MAISHGLAALTYSARGIAEQALEPWSDYRGLAVENGNKNMGVEQQPHRCAGGSGVIRTSSGSGSSKSSGINAKNCVMPCLAL